MDLISEEHLVYGYTNRFFCTFFYTLCTFAPPVYGGRHEKFYFCHKFKLKIANIFLKIGIHENYHMLNFSLEDTNGVNFEVSLKIDHIFMS